MGQFNVNGVISPPKRGKIVAGAALREQRRPTRSSIGPCRDDAHALTWQPQPVAVIAAGLDDPVGRGGDQRLAAGMTGARKWIGG